MIRQVAFSVKTISFLLLNAALTVPESSHVQVIRESVKSGTFQVRSESGQTPVDSRVFQVRVELPNHKMAILDVSMLYDSGSKLFWWQAEPVSSIHQTTGISQMLPRNSAIFLTRSKFVMFWNGWGAAPRILIRESGEHYSSLDEGQANVLHVLGERRGDIQAVRFLHEYKEIAFTGLDKDFTVSKYEAINRGLKLRDVSPVGKQWQIVEDGPNGGTVLIVLDDKYGFVKTTLLPTK